MMNKTEVKQAGKKLVQIQYIPINLLKEWDRNPRRNNEAVDRLSKLIEAHGFINPVIATNDNIIRAGHTRVKAAKKAGLKEVPVIYIDMDDKQAQAYAIADNKSNQWSEWDFSLLKDVMEDLDTGDFDMDLTGFDTSEIENLMTWTPDGKGKGVKEDDFNGEPPKEPITILGDLYELGSKLIHRLHCADSTDIKAVEKLMDGKKASLMNTDPPYGDSWVEKAKDMQKHGYVHSRAGLHGSIESDDKRGEDLYSFLSSFLIVAKEICIKPFPIYVWHRAKRLIFENAITDAGYLVHQPVIWVKPGFVIGRLNYHPRCEWALHGWLQGNGKVAWYGNRSQSDIWEIGRENDKIHPTQKPLELFAIPISNHTKENEICYDPFLGSGSQLIACEQLNRTCYGQELSPAYCDVIVKRYAIFMRKENKPFTIKRNGKELSKIEIEKYLEN